MEKPYKVIKIDALSRLGDIGGIEKYYRITYKTRGGVVDSTDMGEKEYTEENVTATLTKLAEKHDRIMKL